jgi:hypothetical protein
LDQPSDSAYGIQESSQPALTEKIVAESVLGGKVLFSPKFEPKFAMHPF